jgi:predicted  nucleic acid-binding Zn-ribbon protein
VITVDKNKEVFESIQRRHNNVQENYTKLQNQVKTFRTRIDGLETEVFRKDICLAEYRRRSDEMTKEKDSDSDRIKQLRYKSVNILR